MFTVKHRNLFIFWSSTKSTKIIGQQNVLILTLLLYSENFRLLRLNCLFLNWIVQSISNFLYLFFSVWKSVGRMVDIQRNFWWVFNKFRYL